jgi:hypothetical protein
LKNVFTLDVIRRDHDDAFDRLSKMIVNRFDQLETLIERRPELCPGTMLKSRVKHFVHGNLPISQVDAPLFQNLISFVNLGTAGDLPNSHQLMSAIAQRTIALRDSISAATSDRRFVSPMTDGVRTADATAWESAWRLPANRTPGTSFTKSTRRPR